MGDQAQALPPSLGIALAQCPVIADARLNDTDEAERLGHQPVPTLLPRVSVIGMGPGLCCSPSASSGGALAVGAAPDSQNRAVGLGSVALAALADALALLLLHLRREL
eukprot:5556615-Pyramimonas_sp.AAC.1